MHTGLYHSAVAIYASSPGNQAVENHPKYPESDRFLSVIIVPAGKLPEELKESIRLPM